MISITSYYATCSLPLSLGCFFPFLILCFAFFLFLGDQGGGMASMMPLSDKSGPSF